MAHDVDVSAITAYQLLAMRHIIDANQSFGYGCTARPDFATAVDLLRHMDRLGIARAVVWHNGAKVGSARWANNELVADIERTPAAQGFSPSARLLPALSLSPTMPYEVGAIDELIALMRRGNTRALRYPIQRGNWALFDLEPLIDALLPQQPTLFIAIDDGLTKQDIAQFAARFPALPIVITNVMWPPLVNVYEIMRRCPNVLIETSLLHSYQAIEMTVKHFGAERMVFGTHFRSDQGAAIAGLEHAAITEAQRELIAHGNLERLLGLVAPPTRAASATISQAASDRDAFWSRLITRQPLGTDIVDAHAHLGPLGSTFHSLDIAAQGRDMIAYMDRMGIRTTIISEAVALLGHPLQGNRMVEQALAPFGERLRGYFVFNPVYADDLTPYLDEFFARPYWLGFKTLCDYWQIPITDDRFTPMWEYAHAHRLPILNHTWNGWCDAAGMFDKIAAKYPDLTLLLGHSGGGDRIAAEEVCRAHGNIVLEWCGSFTTPAPWERTIQRVGADRIVFGTDAIFHDAAWELGRLVSQPFTQSDLAAILGGNMRRILARRKAGSNPAPPSASPH